MYKRILVPLDGSELAEAVLSYAGILSQHNHAGIVLLQAVEYPADIYANCYKCPPTDPILASA